jgi:hypothetical protein
MAGISPGPNVQLCAIASQLASVAEFGHRVLSIYCADLIELALTTTLATGLHDSMQTQPSNSFAITK